MLYRKRSGDALIASNYAIGRVPSTSDEKVGSLCLDRGGGVGLVSRVMAASVVDLVVCGLTSIFSITGTKCPLDGERGWNQWPMCPLFVTSQVQ